MLNFVDTDPGPKARDGTCNRRTYNGHKGTDIAIRDLAVMKKGIAVRTAASGTVLRIRNNIPARTARENMSQRKGRECGNGIVVQHSGGWESQYCHLRQGSITVRPGDILRRGQRLGLVGMSGRTEFPHVHLSVRHKGHVFDPVTNRLASQPCGINVKTLPTADSIFAPSRTLPYSYSDVYAVGFTDAIPTSHAIKADASELRKLSPDAPAIILWGAMFGATAGQTLSIVIKAPNGMVLVRQEKSIGRTQAWRFAFAGKKRNKGRRWPTGRYMGKITLSSPLGGFRTGSKDTDGTATWSRETYVTIR